MTVKVRRRKHGKDQSSEANKPKKKSRWGTTFDRCDFNNRLAALLYEFGFADAILAIYLFSVISRGVRCWPDEMGDLWHVQTMERLAWITGLTDVQLKAARKSLKDRGLVEWKTRKSTALGSVLTYWRMDMNAFLELATGLFNRRLENAPMPLPLEEPFA